MTKITQPVEGHAQTGEEPDVVTVPAPLLDQASAAVDHRAERYKAYRASLIDPDDKKAAKELARLDREIAVIDLRTLAYRLREEAVTLRALYERLDFGLSMPNAEPPEVDVNTEQCKLNQERHGVYATHKDLPSYLDGTRTAMGIEGLHWRKIRGQRREENDLALTDEEEV
jgi:hypothetical protein